MARPALAFWCSQGTRLDCFDLIAFSGVAGVKGKKWESEKSSPKSIIRGSDLLLFTFPPFAAASAAVGRQAEKDTCRRRVLHRIIAGLPPRLPGSFHNTGNYGSHMLYLCMTAFVSGCGITPIRRSLLDVRPTVDPAGP
ncbi:MAG: hypothetical protein MI807_01335 [Verrucomicrobiales bacterium]|nr:hypothetical protein [Verrucomicrobiales bacterium]